MCDFPSSSSFPDILSDDLSVRVAAERVVNVLTPETCREVLVNAVTSMLHDGGMVSTSCLNKVARAFSPHATDSECELLASALTHLFYLNAGAGPGDDPDVHLIPTLIQVCNGVVSLASF